MADQTLVVLYDDAASARQALDDLRASGLPHDRFWISGNTTGAADLGSSRLTDFVGDFARPESRVRSLTRLGVPEDDAHLYAEGIRRGGTLLIGEVTDDNMERALAIIGVWGSSKQKLRLSRDRCTENLSNEVSVYPINPPGLFTHDSGASERLRWLSPTVSENT